MADEKCDNCKPSILVLELTKRVDKLEDRVDKTDEKIDTSTKETNLSISALKESHAETRAYAKATLEQISDLKSMFKSNNESNLDLILKMAETNANTLLVNNKTNLEANKTTQEITKDIKVNNNNSKVEITKAKIALYGSLIAAIVSVITVAIEKILK